MEGLDEAAADALDDAYGQSGAGFLWGSEPTERVEDIAE
jgi:hypothetical protein